MSFSNIVKKELTGIEAINRHCAAAELAGILLFLGEFDGRKITGLHAETDELKRKVFTLIKKAFNILIDFVPIRSKKRCFAFLNSGDDIGVISDGIRAKKLLERQCCRRSFLRGAFLSVGTICSPDKYYRLEFVCRDPDNANRVFDVLGEEGIEPRISEREGSFIVYLQDAETISFFLGITGANSAVLEFENTRVTREVRGAVQRKVNCETSNLRKTVNASCRQIEDIEFIKREELFEGLPEQLKEIAELRISNPEASLSELGQMLVPPLGRSGVSKRLKRLEKEAEEIRIKKGIMGEGNACKRY